VNQGNPAVLADPGCDFAKAMTALAKTVAQSPHAGKKKDDKKRRLSLARS
jgi:hypothetical protein